ncbi:hypothetical protein AALO_G00301450 [Alosa alosa]|uniref:Uncharacterized protein n=1 Tax=Alosa alosa TaxID=278164 RepID=A0AAV6FHS3_9TELE|nr:hypothetical protein AALO_G00301450 [Alosa alosa]
MISLCNSHRFGDSDDSEEPENGDFASLRYLPTRLVYQLKPQAQANCTGKLHHLAECQAAESLPLNLEKTVKHLTMGQDRNTLYHLNSLHLHLHLTYGELLKERQSLLISLHPHTSPQRAANRGALCCEEKHGDTVCHGH